MRTMSHPRATLAAVFRPRPILWSLRRAAPPSALLAPLACAACGPPAPAGLGADVRLVGVREPSTQAAAATSASSTERHVERQPRRVAAECHGDGLNLNDLDRTKSCEGPKRCSAFDSADCSPVEHAPGPGELAIRVVPESLSVPAGAEIRFRVELENRSAAPLLLDVDATCGIEVSFPVELRSREGVVANYVDADGQVAELAPEGCDASGIMFGCDGVAMRIELVASGVAHVSRQLDGTLPGLVDGRCETVPYPRGTYSLRVTTPLIEAGSPRVAAAKVVIE